MTHDQIDQLGTDVGAEIPTLIGELHEHIREACAAVLEETQDQDNAKPKLNIAIAVSVNLASKPPAYTVKASVSVKRSVSGDYALDDPQQPELAAGLGLKTSVTISSGNTTVHIPAKEGAK